MKVKPLDPVAVAAARRVLTECDVRHARDIHIEAIAARYGALVHAITAQTAAFTRAGSGLPAEAAAEVIAKAVTARKPGTRYTVGRDAALLTFLTRILPDRILDFVAAAALRPYLPK